MRCGPYLLMISLLLGAVPAMAQDAAAAPEKRHAKHAAKKRATPPAVANLATVTSELATLATPSESLMEVGWAVVTDPATGIRIGLPTKMVTHAREAARGTRWSSAHGEVQVETFRIADANLKLAALFEREKKEPANRRVETSVLRDDSFFISGLQGLKKF